VSLKTFLQNVLLISFFFVLSVVQAKLGDLLVCNRTSPLLRQNNNKDMTDYFFYAPEIWFNDQSYKPSFESGTLCTERMQ
jgi:hypothetical protein